MIKNSSITTSIFLLFLCCTSGIAEGLTTDEETGMLFDSSTGILINPRTGAVIGKIGKSGNDRIGIIESEVLKNTYPKDSLNERLNRLETAVLFRTYPLSKESERIKRLFSIIFPASAISSSTSSATIDLNNTAVKAINNGEFSKAVDLLEQLLKSDPNYKLGRQNLAIAYNSWAMKLQDDPRAALTKVRRAVLTDSSSKEARQNLDYLYKKLNLDPNKFADRVSQGDFARKEGDFAGAIFEYEAALAIKNDSFVREKLGAIYLVQGKPDEAISQLKESISLTDTASAELELGRAYLSKSNLNDAVVALNRALKLNEGRTIENIVDMLNVAWEKAVALDPLSPDNTIGLGQAVQLRGDFEQAKHLYLQAISLSPERKNSLAQSLLEHLDSAKAKYEFERNLNDALDYSSKGNFAAAIPSYQRALDLNPNSATAWFNIAACYQSVKDMKKAIEAYERVIQINPSDKEASELLMKLKASVSE